MWTTLIIHGYVHRYSLNNYESDNYPLPSTKFLSSNRKTWFLPVRWSPNWALAALVNGKRPSLPRRLGAVEGKSLWNQSLLGALYRKKHLWISVTPTKMPKNTTDVQCVKIWNNLHLFLKALACTVDSHTTTNLQRYISSPFFLMKQTMVSPSFVPPWWNHRHLGLTRKNFWASWRASKVFPWWKLRPIPWRRPMKTGDDRGDRVTPRGVVNQGEEGFTWGKP